MLWLDVNHVEISDYEERIHRVKDEIDELSEEYLLQAVDCYQMFTVHNPDVKIEDFFRATYSFKNFQKRWEKQVEKINK